MYAFTKDLKQLKADLEATDDETAMVQRYRTACRETSGTVRISITFLFRRSNILEFTPALEILEKGQRLSLGESPEPAGHLPPKGRSRTGRMFVGVFIKSLSACPRGKRSALPEPYPGSPACMFESRRVPGL